VAAGESLICILRAGPRSPSRSRRQRVPTESIATEEARTRLWQRRFWEHQIRDERDLARHIDYIHYNPVKHGLVTTVDDWPWSTYHRFVRDGFYCHQVLNDDDGDFGEDFAGE
jgi:putative transposase